MHLRKGLLGLVVIVLLACFFMTIIAFRMPAILNLQQQEFELLQQIEEKWKIVDTLEAQLENYGSDASVEDIARSQLGFVKKNQIVFIPSE